MNIFVNAYHSSIFLGRRISVPVGQMLSQIHTLNFIKEWLEDLFQKLKSPDEVILDQSSALIGAVVMVFSKCEGKK